MPLLFVREDITRMQTDAVVCPTDAHFSARGGTDAAIHRKAGLQLRRTCRRHGTLQSGEVFRTSAYHLPSRYIFHVFGPVWQGGVQGETEALGALYTHVLEEADKSECESIAFPVLSAGSFGFPADLAIHTAVQSIQRFPGIDRITVYLVFYDAQCTELAQRYRFLRQEWERPAPPQDRPKSFSSARNGSAMRQKHTEPCANRMADEAFEDACAMPQFRLSGEPSLEELLLQQDESFSEMLLRLIDERGMTDAQCYKKANIDRKLFSKIRSNRLYKPSKNTALAFAVALCLSAEQTKELLQKAGYALTHASKADIIVEYYIRRGVYDIFEINEALFAYDQTLLG